MFAGVQLILSRLWKYKVHADIRGGPARWVGTSTTLGVVDDG